MATEYPGNVIPSPGFYQGNVANDDELLVSTKRFTQWGVTLKPGQGILPLGTVLAQDTVSKQYVKYNSAGSNGADTARGILRTSVDTGSDSSYPALQGNIVISGILNLSKISSANSGVPNVLSARTDDVLNTFTF